MKHKVISVSIVDDDSELRESIKGYLQTIGGFRCIHTYATAEEAVGKLAQEKPDVVLMDIKMKGMDGIECVRRLKPLTPKSQFVMLTVFQDAELIFNALKAGASGYLLKLQPPAKLAEAVLEVAEGGSPMSASIARKVVNLLREIPGHDSVSKAAALELSTREREVLDGLAAGKAYKQIADGLGMSIHTVRTYVRRIYEKLHVHTSAEAVAKFFKQPLDT